VVQGASTANVFQYTYGGTATNDEWQPVDLGNGYFRIVNRNSGKVLDVSGASTADGARVVQWPWTGSANQQWNLLPNPDGSVRLRSVNSGKVLDSPAGSAQGAALDQSADSDSDNQRWHLVPATTSGYYRLVNVHNGWCADVSGGSTADGAAVIQWAPGSGANQEWQPIGL
jgi:alpha-L-fucosidase